MSDLVVEIERLRAGLRKRLRDLHDGGELIAIKLDVPRHARGEARRPVQPRTRLRRQGGPRVSVVNYTTASIWESVLFCLGLALLATPGAFLVHEAPAINELLRAECERALMVTAECLVAEIETRLREGADMSAQR